MKTRWLTAIALLLVVFLSASAWATTYYVDGNLMSDCDGTSYHYDVGNRSSIAGPGQIAWRSLKSANSVLAPGDTVYLRKGTYYPTDRTDCIHPARSGTSGNRITYANYNGESVTIDGTNDGNLEAILFSAGWDTGNPSDGRSYITVRGINIANWNKLGELRYASYNEITDCDFSGHKGDGTGVSYNGFFITQESAHNWIHGNTWHTFGNFVGDDNGCLLNIGHDNTGNAVNSGNNYNTVEDNHFYASGHHIIGVNNAKFNVIRNNYFHNEGWSTAGACASCATGVCGYRVMSMTDNSGLDVAGSNLLEDNNIAYGAQYGGPHLVQGASGSGLTLATAKNIVRYNDFFGNVLMGLRIGSSIGNSNEGDNRIYNNTFYYNGYNLDSWGVVNEDDVWLDPVENGDDYRTAMMFYGNSSSCSGSAKNNVIKNNLAHDMWSETHKYGGASYYPAFYTALADTCNTVTHNWGNTGRGQAGPFTPYADPKFVDPDVSDPMALSFVNGKWTGKPDLSLQASSPAIDGGTYLTQANGSGSNSTTLIVDDAMYFQDGTWGSDLARATFHADWIAIGTVTNRVQISSINYNTNTITLASPMTWSNNAPVWLYKKSKGDVVLSGSAPDYGAHEYVPGISLNSPTGGETWVQGFSHDITWASSGVTEPVKIELFKVSTLQWDITVPFESGTSTWQIPINQAVGSDYSIKISAGSYTDTSGAFTIAAPAAPYVNTLAAQSVTTSSALLRGTVHPMGLSTTYYFEYGPTTAYGSETSGVTLDAGDVETAVQSPIAGFNASTTYYFRLVATNSAGTTYGNDLTFMTSANGGGGSGSGDSGGGGGGGGCFIAIASRSSLRWKGLGIIPGLIFLSLLTSWYGQRREAKHSPF